MTELEKKVVQHVINGVELEILNYKCDYVGIRYAKANGYYFLDGELHITYEGGSTGKSLESCRLRLRPLSDLINEIEYNKEKIIPLIEIANSNYYIINNLADKFDRVQKNNDNYFLAYSSKKTINKYQFQLGTFDEHGNNNNLYFRYYVHDNISRDHYSDLSNLNKLFSWHFDMYLLIEKGLAIDINTIKDEDR